MKSTSILTLALLAAGSLMAADSASEQVIQAAKKLAAEPNYSWKTTVAVPEDSRFKPGPTEGMTEKDGCTCVNMSFGENKFEMAMKGDKAAMKNQEGEWKSAAEMENAEGPGRWIGMMARNLKLPAAQAEEIVGYTKDLKKDGDAYVGTLSEEGVKNLLSMRRRAGAEPPQVSSPSGSSKFWVKDGLLSKYEFKVKGTMSFNGNDMTMDRTTTVEIKDPGKTKVQLPDEAKKKLS